MVALLALTAVTCENPFTGVFVLSIGLGFLGFNNGGGYCVNVNDIGGKYSGVLFGISNTFATLPGIIVPYFVSLMTPNQNLDEWNIVFYITAFVFLIGAIVSQLMCSTDLEAWAGEEQEVVLINELAPTKYQ
jgi:hypothetical protein